MNKDKRYKFYVHERKDGVKEVIAVSSYAGKTVKAKAVCSPDDEFDIEKGKELAKLRCALKIENKRLKRAVNQKDWLFKFQVNLEKAILKNQRYVNDTFQEIKYNEAALEFLLKELK